MWQLGQSQQAQQIGAHDAPVKAVGYLAASNIVVSGGWDAKLKFWDQRQPNPVLVFDLPERVYDLDVRNNLLVVATAGRHILAYDVSGSPQEHTRKESPLKFQSRCISCFPDGTGFAVGSIEGRVGIQYLQKIPGKESFAFKCHRQDTNVYSVNAIAFQEQFGTFATVGSDGECLRACHFRIHGKMLLVRFSATHCILFDRRGELLGQGQQTAPQGFFSD